ncbi:MAG TPA: YbaK/EbsC family protein [Candidatus Binatia bacterium]
MHPAAYTAEEIAEKQHVSSKELAKVVMLEVDDKLVMGVLPGSLKIHVDTARASLGASMVELATEDEFMSRFPECEIGATRPFGNLFGLKVVVDPALERDEHIYFNAGNHVQTVRMKYQDFGELVKPQIVPLSKAKEKWDA